MARVVAFWSPLEKLVKSVLGDTSRARLGSFSRVILLGVRTCRMIGHRVRSLEVVELLQTVQVPQAQAEVLRSGVSVSLTLDAGKGVRVAINSTPVRPCLP